MDRTPVHAATQGGGVGLVGCAGWGIPRGVADCFPLGGSQLQRYAQVFGAVEINSSFYRPHQKITYQRWAGVVPEGFRFSVKLPKHITHELRLANTDKAMAQFADEAGALGSKLGCVLVQLPPSLRFDAQVAARFFTSLAHSFACQVACEARHPSWFSADATALLHQHGVTRVQADPPKGQTGPFEPTTAAAYIRLHGSPLVYYSAYTDAQLDGFKAKLARATEPTWLIFDNTASGAAQRNALTVLGVPLPPEASLREPADQPSA